jgi:hypothetical protein
LFIVITINNQIFKLYDFIVPCDNKVINGVLGMVHFGKARQSIDNIGGYKKLKSMGRVKILNLILGDYENQINEVLKSLDIYYLVDIKEIGKDTLMIIYKDFEKE